MIMKISFLYGLVFKLILCCVRTSSEDSVFNIEDKVKFMKIRTNNKYYDL